MWKVWWRKQLHTGCWCVGVKEGDGLEDLGVDGRMIRKWILNKYDGRVECVWLWMSTTSLLFSENEDRTSGYIGCGDFLE